MPPVRTRFEERLIEARRRLLEYATTSRNALRKGVRAYLELNEPLRDEVIELRRQIRAESWRVEEQLLLLLSLHHPLTLDLRTIAAYLRSVAAFERMGRHARDVAAAINELGDRIPPPQLAALVAGMAESAITIQEEVIQAIEAGDLADEAVIERAWASVSADLEAGLDLLSDMGKGDGVPKRDRLVHSHVLRRLERSAYNAVRVADFWHHALTGRWIVLEDPDYEQGEREEEEE